MPRKVVVHESIPIRTPGELEVEAKWETAPPRRSPFSVPQLVTFFQFVGAWGGFAGDSVAPDRSRLMIREKNVTDRTGSWLFQADSVDAGALTVLSNVLTFSHMQVAPLQRAVIRSSLTRSATLPPPPSGRQPHTPFDVDADSDANELLISIEFVARPRGRETAMVRKLLRAWQFLAAAGGFERDIGEVTRPLLVPELGPTWSDGELWSRVDLAGFDSLAVDALINMMQSVHTRVAPIVAIEVS